MNIRIALAIVSLVVSVLIGLTLAKGGLDVASPRKQGITIGLSLDTLKEARWQADRDMFVKRAGGARGARASCSPPTATTRCRSATSRS